MEKFKDLCTKIKEAVPTSSTWEMDSRFDTTLVGLDIDAAESVREDLCNIFDYCYDHKSIRKSTQEEKKLSMKLGGVEKKQFLFTSLEEKLVLFCAWWPWGNQSKISLRVGVFDSTNALIENKKIINWLKEWFSIAD